MDKSKFTETKTCITYKINTAYHKRDYHIEISRLGQICSYEHGYPNISDWVAHLSGLTWASKRMMIELCEIIKRLHPDSGINWGETYRYIDSIAYETT